MVWRCVGYGEEQAMRNKLVRLCLCLQRQAGALHVCIASYRIFQTSVTSIRSHASTIRTDGNRPAQVTQHPHQAIRDITLSRAPVDPAFKASHEKRPSRLQLNRERAKVKESRSHRQDCIPHRASKESSVTHPLYQNLTWLRLIAGIPNTASPSGVPDLAP